MSIKKMGIILLIGLTVSLTAAVSATADEIRETDIPVEDAIIEHEAVDGEQGVEEPLVIAENTEESAWVIAPNPTSGSQDISANAAGNTDETFDVGLPILGSIGVIAGIAIALIVLKKK